MVLFDLFLFFAKAGIVFCFALVLAWLIKRWLNKPSRWDVGEP